MKQLKVERVWCENKKNLKIIEKGGGN